MTPLDAQLLRELPECLRVEKLLIWIPIIGWLILAAMAKAFEDIRFFPLVERIEKELQNRHAESVSALWGDEWTQVERIQSIIAHEIGWSSPAFIPDDSMAIVLWSHEDGLDAECALAELEREYDIKFSKSEEKQVYDLTMGEFVANLKERIERSS